MRLLVPHRSSLVLRCLLTAALVAPLAGACGGSDGGHGSGGDAGGDGGGKADDPAAGQDWTRDILTTDLQLDLSAMTGRATITLAGSDSTSASFEIGDLTIRSVTSADGDALAYQATGSELDVGVPASDDLATLVVDYDFAAHDNFDGWMPDSEVSFLWPTFCGNLYPCKSDPADGVQVSMTITGVPEGQTAIYPASIPAPAPSYMPAVAVADFTELGLGQSTGGVDLSVWYLPGQADVAAQGTAHLLDVFSFYESTYGPYSFGDKAGSVSANWGGGDYGGMEHHPFWHVSSGSLYSEEVNAHEAAHGWYGDGVRIGCWEDFVLSEGTATYLAARALGQSGVDLWPDYECELKTVCQSATTNTIALPDTCDQIDILHDKLWSNVPYMKGAFFYKAVADLVGAGALDQALSGFYQDHVGKAARMQELIDYIKTRNPDQAAGIDDLATAWLETLDCPVDPTTLCQG